MQHVLWENGNMPSVKKDRTSQGIQISTDKIYNGQIVLAFIIDDEVVQTFMCDERMAAILQSNPTIVEITNKDPFLNGPHVGWKYKDGTFSMPKPNKESIN
jgi:hypothetical protein